MGVLADWQIELEKIVEPFVPEQRQPGKITHGCSSYGYDVRVAREFRVFNPVRGAGKIIDPKHFDQTMLELVEGDHCIIPANSFALGVTVERLTIPRDCLAIVVGKSTNARCGLVVNVTPLEPDWTGHVTIEISNTAPIPAKVYAGEGIAQVVFLRADGVAAGIIDYLLGLAVHGYESFEKPEYADENLSREAFEERVQADIRRDIAARLCRKSYADKGGRYQNQGMAVTLPCASGGSAHTVGALDAATAAVVSEAVGLTPPGSAAAELAAEVAARLQAQAALAAGADRHFVIKDSGRVSEVKPPG